MVEPTKHREKFFKSFKLGKRKKQMLRFVFIMTQ